MEDLMAEKEHSGTFEHEAPEPGPEHARLEVFIGKWINEGVTVGTPEEAKILTSDVYEWIPGRFAVLHTAYGRIGEMGVGGVEVLGYDAERGNYTSHFFDSQGHVTVDDLIYDDGKWIWAGERIRTTSEFSDDGRIQRSLHEQTEDGVEWRLAMDVTLKKVE
ncbi:MAG TPA: DUF1579 family protein [Solirubrobacterales bacterium]|jgi:hypothetical protein